MHIRKSNKKQSNFWFLFDHKTVPYCTTYKYLGTTINQYLNFEVTAEAQCDSAGRALSAIIKKMIKDSGFPYNVYSNLIDSCVNSITDYGGSVIGFDQHEGPLKIHSRAARAFLGIPKNGVKCAILSEIDWLLPKYRTRLRMVRQFHRMSRMTDDRLTKKVLKWDKKLNNAEIVQTWYSEVKQILFDCNFQNIYENNCLFPLKPTIKAMQTTLKSKQNNELKTECLPMPKLRTFNIFTDFENQPSYLSKPLNYFQRRSIATMRVGSFRIRAETQRYFRPKVPYERRFCITCPNENQEVECETHYLFSCSAYGNLRHTWLNKLEKPENFERISLEDKLKLVLNNPANVKHTANFISDAFNARSKILF